CPDAWFLNYTNPMAMLTGGMLLGMGVKTVGLCHSVQGCARGLLWQVGMHEEPGEVQAKIAGINHMAWLLEITRDGQDLYPEIKRRAAKIVRDARRPGAEKHRNMVRLEIMRHFGYYVTESSEHMAEYTPYWIKSRFPELIEEFNIPLDEYPRRSERAIRKWEEVRREVVKNRKLKHKRGIEYGSRIMEAMETNVPLQIGGNVLNHGLITNLPPKACVEVPCLVDRNGVQGTYIGELPEACAALNRTSINVQLLTLEAFFTGKKEHVYQAAMLDPHTGSELTLDQIRNLCDDLIEAHGSWLPKFK
ncbi:alpha-glucosidase/alpha-galactosidase, partial [Candidatus Sumerlaeota bacterium]